MKPAIHEPSHDATYQIPNLSAYYSNNVWPVDHPGDFSKGIQKHKTQSWELLLLI